MELAHEIMEDDKPYDLVSASWRTRKADGISPSQKVQESWSESKGLRIQESQCAMSKGRQEKTDVSAQAEGANLPFLCLFSFLGPELIGLCPPTLGRAICFTQFINANTYLFQV